MLPSGPRSTYQLPPTPQAGSRQLAQEILATIDERIRNASEIRVGTVTTGCDGKENINPLNGTTCNGEAPAGACDLVLYHPQTRSVVSRTVGRAFTGNGASCLPGAVGFVGGSSGGLIPNCADVATARRRRRRFKDNLGNHYGPDGAWLSGGWAVAELETDYIHRLFFEGCVEEGPGFHDPAIFVKFPSLFLEKTTGAPAQIQFWKMAQGLGWPSVNDLSIPQEISVDSSDTPSYIVTSPASSLVGIGLDDVKFGGVFTGTLPTSRWVKITTTGGVDKFDWGIVPGSAIGSNINIPTLPITHYNLTEGLTVRFGATTGHTLNDEWTAVYSEPPAPTAVIGLNDLAAIGPATGDARWYIVWIDSVGTVDTFSWYSGFVGESVDMPFVGRPAIVTGVPIDGLAQPLYWPLEVDGVSIQFGSVTGHTVGDQWGIVVTNDGVVREGVAVRGTITGPRACPPVIPVNTNVLMTTELNCIFVAHPYQSNKTPPSVGGAHALVVRGPDTLALLYRKPLLYDGSAFSWGASPQKFSFSTNEEGLFFMHCYTVPALVSPPTPFPGAEFGSPNPRKVAVVSVDPDTFEPTIVELITLEDNGSTIGSTFVVAFTE